MERENRFWRVISAGAAAGGSFAAFVVWPLASSFYYSFTNWNGFNPDYDYVGFANFLKIHTDKLFLNAAINTAFWIVAAIVVPTCARVRARAPDRQPHPRRLGVQVDLLPADLPLCRGGGADLGLDLPAGLGASEHCGGGG